MSKIFLALMVQFCFSSAYAQFVTGNHGEGVEMRGHVYLRDLYMYDQIDNLYFGNGSDPAILLKMKDFDRVELSPTQRDLLVRKLSDIEKVAPCLGSVIVDMMYFYNWAFVRETFPVPEESQTVGTIQEGTRVVVAKRFYSDILLQRQSWDKMSDGHKVGLILHEMFYAILRPIHLPHVKGAAFQDVNIIRGFVSNLFNPPSSYTAAKFKTYLRDLDIVPGIRCESPRVFSAAIGPHFAETLVTSPRSERGMQREMKALCEHALKSQAPMELTVSTSPYSIQERRYKAFDGKDENGGFGQQTWNRICPAEVHLKRLTVSTVDLGSCVDLAKSFVTAAADPRDYAAPAIGCNANPW